METTRKDSRRAAGAALVLLAAVAAGLPGCGGGGGGSRPPQAGGPQSSFGGAQTPQSENDAAAQPYGNSPPRLGGVPPTTVKVGDNYVFDPEASDADGDELTFDIVNKPDWAFFDTSTGRLSGVPRIGAAGTYEGIEISVTDGSAINSTGPFSVSVVQTATGSITVTWQPPTLNEDGTALTDLSAYKIYWGTRSGEYSDSVEIENVGVSSYVIEDLVPGQYFVAATAVNSAGVESDFSSELVATVN